MNTFQIAVILSEVQGALATGTQSKDPEDFTIDVPLPFRGILRLRYACLSASAQDDCDLGGSSRTKNHAPRVTPLRMTRDVESSSRTKNYARVFRLPE